MHLSCARMRKALLFWNVAGTVALIGSRIPGPHLLWQSVSRAELRQANVKSPA